MQADPRVTRWTPLIVQALREAGFAESELARWTAAGLALIHYESRGNPSAQHGTTGAYGLTQQIGRWHPQHKGDPINHLRHWAGSMAKYYRGGNTANHIPSTILVWGSGPGAVSAFVKSGETVHTKVFKHIRNIEGMTSGGAWQAYSSWLTGWTAAGSPTIQTAVEGRSHQLATTTTTPGGALHSPWDGYITWKGQKRKVGSAGPGGLMGLQLGTSSPSFLPLLGLGAILIALLTWWGSGR